MRAKKLSKRMLALLLSAIMIAEPASGSMVARAAEPDAGQVMLEEGADVKEETEENSGSVEEREEGDTSDDQESGAVDSENQDEEKEDPDEQDKENLDEENPDEKDSEEEIVGEDQDVSISGNDIDGDETEEGEDDLGKFSAMPSGYRLTSEQKEMKSALSASMGEFDESQEGKTYVKRQVFAFADTKEEAEAIAEAYHAELIEYDEGVVVLKLTEDTSVGEALCVAADLDNNFPAVYPDYYRYAHVEESASEKTAQSDSSITFVEEEYALEGDDSETLLSEEPTLEAYERAVDALGDPNMHYGSQYYQWQHVNVGSVYAWEAKHKGADIKVAVLDSGVSVGSSDSLNVVSNINTTDEKSAADGYGHGTHVAGIIAAKLDNKGGAGIAPEAQIVNIKVLGNDGSGTDSDIIQGINAAANANVDIMNMSLGGIGFNPATEKAVNAAYEKGIAIFVSAGNDGGNNMCYPAALDNVICIGAVDNNNQRASFSNYGSWVDLSAPGVNIWSIGIDANEDEGFACMSGTSQASPVAAGEAAVILSAELPDIKGKTGSEKVDALKKVMQSNTVSAGSGMGKGVTSLTKVFKLSTAVTKPNAPAISTEDTSSNIVQSMDIIIEAQAGMKICYTTNGKNPVFKNGEAGAGTIPVDSNTVTISVSGADAAKGTIKAIAVNASGVTSAVKSYTYTLKSYVKTITVSGPARVEKGKSIQLAVAVTPAYATDKSVEWTLQTADSKDVESAKISIKNGKITTTSIADVGTYKVTVAAKDGSGITGTYTIEVVEVNTAIQKISFDKNAKKELWIDAKPAENKVSLFNSVIAEEKDSTTGKNKQIPNETALQNRLVWTSSKPAVAEVDIKTGEVTAKAVGTTTITVKADDNLAKKATVNITVKQAVTGITITTDKGETANKYFSVAPGKGIALKAKIDPVKPTNNKVNWSIAPSSGTAEDDENIKNNNITINKANGKITTKETAVSGSYIVTAEAADGKGAKATKTVTVVEGAIGEIKFAPTKVTLYTTAAGGDTEATITATIKGVTKNGTEGKFDPNAYMVTNSNPSVVKMTETASSAGQVTLKLESVGTMFGKANIVISSTDGSNKKATCAVTVSGGISKVEIVDAKGGTKKVSKLTLFRGNTVNTAPSTATLYAKITGSNGANVKAYKVESNNKLVTVESYDTTTGEIKLKASSVATGKATITAMATDGSKKKATCTVTVVNPVSKVNIAVKGSNSSYIAKGKSLQLQASLESEYGAVSNKKVTWSIDEAAKNITINSSGKISAKTNATGSGTDSKGNPLNRVIVTATACDGSNAKATYNVYITDPVQGIGLWSFVTYYNRLTGAVFTRYEKLSTGNCWERKLIKMTDNQDRNDAEDLGGCYAIDLGWDNDVVLRGGVTVSSSNPSVMSATVRSVYDEDLGGYVPKVCLSADKVGTTTITIKAMDGGGSQVKYKFKVVKEYSH